MRPYFCVCLSFFCNLTIANYFAVFSVITFFVTELSDLMISEDSSSNMSEVIMQMVRPAIERMDEQVKNTRRSQLYLANHVDLVSSKLKHLVDEQLLPFDLNAYVRKLDDSRKRINGISQRLQALQSRMGHLQRGIARETFKQKQ